MTDYSYSDIVAILSFASDDALSIADDALAALALDCYSVSPLPYAVR